MGPNLEICFLDFGFKTYFLKKSFFYGFHGSKILEIGENASFLSKTFLSKTFLNKSQKKIILKIVQINFGGSRVVSDRVADIKAPHRLSKTIITQFQKVLKIDFFYLKNQDQSFEGGVGLSPSGGLLYSK